VTEVWQRPLRSDAERNRRLVLEAAAQAFAEEGFDVGMAEIARRAGVGNATVFRRFPTKDALYEAIVDEKIAELCAAAAIATELPDPWDALVRYLEATAGLQARDRGFFQATEQHLLEHPELLRRHRVILDLVEPLVLRAQEAGVVRVGQGRGRLCATLPRPARRRLAPAAGHRARRAAPRGGDAAAHPTALLRRDRAGAGHHARGRADLATGSASA